jgi:hypothetical protein
MQAKVFTPDWLAGTLAGEVLFQADYHLKELSMGEYDQPVVGMKSCFDFSEMEKLNQKWCARQWFIVRKAEVQICDGDVLLPFVKMGVEAREQVASSEGLVDKPLTRPDHPMAKYAEGFTQNFDLIAERKSVIYHLRELAKASVLAKYLLDSNAQLEETWFHLASEVEAPCSMEVPQLWHERLHALVSTEQGPACLTLGKASSDKHMHGVYGGVQFGLEKFNLASSGARSNLSAGLSASRVPLGLQRVARLPGMTTAQASLSLAPAQAGLSLPTRFAAAQLSLKAPTVAPLARRVPGVPGVPVTATSLKVIAPELFMASSRIPSALTAVSPPRLAGIPPPMAGVMPNLQQALRAPGMAPGARPAVGAPPVDDRDRLQGVDLRLDNFDLSSAKRVSLEAQSGSWGNVVKPLDECMRLGDAFWSSLEGSSPFKESDQALLAQVFNPFLSDRRSEGDRFVPPDASYSHVAKLRALIKEEESVRSLRKEAFCKKEFNFCEPGNLFPSSWSSKLEVLKGRKPVALPEGLPEARPATAFVERPEYLSQASEMLKGILATGAPEFDKKTEDGMRFRVYRLGGVEVRTTQEHDGEERVGVIFTIRDSDVIEGSSEQVVQPQEKITKATEYVECKFSSGSAAGHSYYLVLSTDKGHKILTERLENGCVTWEENPRNLEDRNSLAKVTRSKECAKGATVRDLQKRVAGASENFPASASVRKLWCRSTFSRLAEKSKKEEDPVLAAKRKEKLGLQA